MSTENKSIDLAVESQIAYSLMMQFEDVESTAITANITPIDLTGCTFKGVIKGNLDPTSPVLESFAVAIVDAALGVVSVHLTKQQTANLSTKASSIRDKYNPRLRFVGYYDIILTKPGTGTEFRVLEGKVFISDGVTA